MAALRLLIPAAAMTCAFGIALGLAEDQVVRRPSIPDSQLLRRVDPRYPRAALQRRIQGTVRFEAMIGKEGRVESLRLISGHPLLIAAARAAAKRWIYRPTIVCGKAVRVITQVEVEFELDAYGRPRNRRPPAPRAAGPPGQIYRFTSTSPRLVRSFSARAPHKS